MIHSSQYEPKLSPIYVDTPDIDLDRIQDLTATLTMNRTKVDEIGRIGIVGWRQLTPSVTVSMKQLEYGNMAIYNALANNTPAITQVSLTDFKASAFDIMAFATNDSGVFLGTIMYPRLRLSGFTINISDPMQVIERTFNFVGEDEISFENNSAYVVRQRYVAPGNQVANAALSITVNTPTPQVDPDNSGKFIYRVIRTSANLPTAGTTLSTELNWGTDWSYDGVSVLHINNAYAGDVFWVWYAASSYLPGVNIFTYNNTDVPVLTAECASIFLGNGAYVYRLQSVSIDSTLNRKDIREIGNYNIVSEGVDDYNTKVTLGRVLETFTVEEFLRGVGTGTGQKLDPRKFQSNFALYVNIYSANTKLPSQYKMSYVCTDLAPTKMDTGSTVQQYVTAGNTLEGQTLFITNNIAIV